MKSNESGAPNLNQLNNVVEVLALTQALDGNLNNEIETVDVGFGPPH